MRYPLSAVLLTGPLITSAPARAGGGDTAVCTASHPSGSAGASPWSLLVLTADYNNSRGPTWTTNWVHRRPSNRWPQDDCLHWDLINSTCGGRQKRGA